MKNGRIEIIEAEGSFGLQGARLEKLHGVEFFIVPT